VEADVLLDTDGWRVTVPARQLTEGHLAIARKKQRAGVLDATEATDLLNCYRTTTAVLHQVLGCDGFSVSTSLGWTRTTGGSVSPTRSTLT